MCKECCHSYFCGDTFLLRGFLPILNSLFSLLTTSLSLMITADRPNRVWLQNSLYRREVETNTDNSRNFKFLFLVQCLAWVLIFEEFILGQHSVSFPFLKECLGFFCVFLTSETRLLHDWKLWSRAPLWSYQTIWKITKR